MEQVRSDPELVRRRDGALTWRVVRLFVKRYLKTILWLLLMWMAQLLRWVVGQLKYSHCLL